MGTQLAASSCASLSRFLVSIFETTRLSGRIDDFPLDVDDAIHAATASPGINEQDPPSSFTGGLTRGVPATNEELMELFHEFLDKLRNGTAPWVVQRLNHTYGPEPVNDPSNFSFWMALVSSSAVLYVSMFSCIHDAPPRTGAAN
jgi:hypothetical protein